MEVAIAKRRSSRSIHFVLSRCVSYLAVRRSWKIRLPTRTIKPGLPFIVPLPPKFFHRWKLPCPRLSTRTSPFTTSGTSLTLTGPFNKLRTSARDSLETVSHRILSWKLASKIKLCTCIFSRRFCTASSLRLCFIYTVSFTPRSLLLGGARSRNGETDKQL